MQSPSRCFTTRAPQSEPPLFQNGRLVLQPHDIGWIVSGVFTIIATIISGWLIFKHLVWYTNGNQQRYIVRLLLMVPIYAIVSFASYFFYNHSVPLTLIRDSYESFVIYCFFYLLLEYLSPTTEGQKDVVRKAEFQKWLFPLGFVSYRSRDGLYFLQLMKWGILQYCVVRPGTTVAAVILDFIGLYCEDSWSFRWGHVYVTVLVSLSVTIAMYCLLQFYTTLATELGAHRPLLKFISIKSVVFLTFWQGTLLSVLATFGLLKDTPAMTSDAIQNGIATILETVEMTIFAVVHLKAFSYVDYVPQGGTAGRKTSPWRSLKHVLDIREFWRELINGSDYMSKTIRGVETDGMARRRLHFARVMGREREESLLKEHAKSGDENFDDDDEGDNTEHDLEGLKSANNLHNSRFGDEYHNFSTKGARELRASIVHPMPSTNHYSRVGYDRESTSPNTRTIEVLSNSRLFRSGNSPEEHQIRSTPLRSTETESTGTGRTVIRPTEIYNVPLEKDVLLSLQQKEVVPNMLLTGHSHGTTRFLASTARSRSVNSQTLFTENAKILGPSRGLPRHKPPRIVLPAPLG